MLVSMLWYRQVLHSLRMYHLNIIAGGAPVEYHGVNTSVCRAKGFDEKVLKHIANAYRLLFHGQTSVFDACIQIDQQVPDSTEIRNIVNFVRGTEAGIISKL